MNWYFEALRGESFVNKHAVVGVWVAIVLAVIQAAFAFALHSGAQALQRQSQGLQRLQFLEDQNDKNRERLAETLRAFGSEGRCQLAPGPAVREDATTLNQNARNVRSPRGHSAESALPKRRD